MPTDPFDAAAFRAFAHDVVDLMADHLTATGERKGPVMRWQQPNDRLAELPGLDGKGGGDPLKLMQHLCEQSNRLHHPRYMGHQVSVPQPMLSMFEALCALLNNGMAAYEMGPVHSAMEVRTLQWFTKRLGLPADADGLFTSGGSLGNLTALLVARRHAEQRHGLDQPFCVLTSDQTHYCIDRAAKILGLGPESVISVPVDEQFAMRSDKLRELANQAREQGRTPIAVIGNAGTTATGSFDPLDEIADCCEELGLWFHVDGAHGAVYALAPSVRQRLRGLERADSIVIDAHKMMQIPALVTAVLFRRGADATFGFSQQAPYIFAAEAPEPWYDRGRRTVECTKRGMGVQVYAYLSMFGEAPLIEHLEQQAELARELAGQVKAAADFELLTEPQCNIVCFRHAPAGVADLDTHNRKLRARMLDDGSFYIVQTMLPQGLYLRTTLMNPRTTEADLRAMLAGIRDVADG